MARRRMFNLDIIDTDLFLEMPQSSRLLYYDLCMRADDDGFVSTPKKIQKIVGCSDDDFKVLISKKFIIPFDTGVVVIKHWKIHNYVQKDRYKETLYTEEKSHLTEEKNGTYELMDPNCIQNGYTGKDSIELGKYSIDKNNTTTNIYEYVEELFGRTLNTIELQKIDSWLLSFSEDIIKYAFEIATLNSKRTFGYVEGILKNWSGCNYTTLEEIKEAESSKKEAKKVIPDWFKQKIESSESSDKLEKSDEDFNNFLKEFRSS